MFLIEQQVQIHREEMEEWAARHRLAREAQRKPRRTAQQLRRLLAVPFTTFNR